MERLYYIGEVAEILNISTQTLRYYDRIGILQPAYTDPSTGYRKYTYDQVSYVDRIRYLQNLGLSLDEVHAALKDNDPALLTQVLEEKTGQLRKELQSLTARLEDLDWYRDYYGYMQSRKWLANIPFLSHKETRYILTESFRSGDPPYGIGHRLLRRKNSSALRRLTYRRQNGYLLDLESLIKGVFRPTHYWVLLRDTPEISNPHILQIPAGNYFCFHCRLLSDAPFPQQIVETALPHIQDDAVLAIAPQYETNFRNFQECPHEVQILLREGAPDHADL